LEKYLNAYDKLFRIKYVNDLLNNAKNKIENAQSIDEINNVIQEYKQQIDHFK
jgi:isochorismate synthase EntC